MSDHADETDLPQGIGRRDFIRRSAIVGGMVWAAPIVQSMGSPAFAQEGSPIIGEDCPDGNVFQFKWEADNGFVDCSTGAGTGCEDIFESNLNCVAATTENVHVGTVTVDGTTITVTATKTSETCATFVFEDSHDLECEVRALQFKGGTGVGCVDSTQQPNGNTLEICTGVVEGGGLSFVDAIICCAPVTSL